MGYALSGKTALVTGANRGIGEAIVDALVAAGVKKVYATGRNISALGPLVDRHGSRLVPLQLDVTNGAHIAAAAATATDVDLLVNSAGIVGFFGGEFTDPKWIEGGRQEMEVNFLGTFAVTQAFAPVLAKNGGGAIANLDSVASFVSFPILAAYSASKAATHSLTQVMRTMLRGQNTQVFGVYPGPIDTKMGEVLTLEKASPADAAEAIVAGIIAGPATKSMRGRLTGKIGAFAEFIAIDEGDVAIKPKALTMEEAASIPLVGLTAWQALIERARLKQGHKVLIHAGSGGVGTFAIQLAKHVGATVATTTSTPMWNWSEASAPTSWSITRRRTSQTCSVITTSS